VATGRIIGQSSGNYVRAVLINVGRTAGVARGNVAVDADGVLGRVIAVGERTARVLLLTDLNSRIPVKVLPAGVNAILVGDNLDQPQVSFLPADAKVSAGDWIVTTGHGGIFPPDLPVGRVVNVPKSGAPRVALAADLTRLDYIRVLRFSPEDHAVTLPATPDPVETMP
jgi:rod shape-determining protein MreC